MIKYNIFEMKKVILFLNEYFRILLSTLIFQINIIIRIEIPYVNFARKRGSCKQCQISKTLDEIKIINYTFHHRPLCSDQLLMNSKKITEFDFPSNTNIFS